MTKVAIQSDPPDSFDPKSDTTLAIALEGLCRTYDLHYYHPSSLTSDNGTIKAFVHPLSADLDTPYPQHLITGSGKWLALDSYDVILVRQDPPYDMAYLTATYLLEHLPPSVKIVNPPLALRNYPEKILPPELHRFLPPTLITHNLQLIREFARKHHDDIIVKPLYGNGGRGVFRIKPDDKNLPVVLETLTAIENLPVVAQATIRAIDNGDKRIILINGKAEGAVNRIASKDDNRSNLHTGGTAHQSSITKSEQTICDALAPFLKKHHIILAGIDVIGDYLTEINITSPTCFREYQQFTGINLASLFWNAITDD